MAEDANTPETTISDPHNVPVTYANAVFGGVWNGLVSLTFVANRLTPTIASGKVNLDNDNVIVSRLRLDLHSATALRDHLDSVIALLTTPEGKPN